MAGIGSHTKPNRGATEEWLTPPGIINALGKFDLDPCSPVVRPWDTALTHYTKDDDGLSQQWFGRVFLNPPYGTETHKWLKKMAEHNHGTAIMFARTETKMFFDYVWSKASALLFIKGRPHFHLPDGTRAKGNSGGPVVLVAYGAFDAFALRDANDCGDIEGQFIRM